MNSAIHDKGANLTDQEGRRLEKKAMKQDDIIIEFFERHKGRPYTPWEVHRALGETMLITSVRRSLSNLTEQGILIKREDYKKMEETDTSNNTWMMPAGKQLELL